MSIVVDPAVATPPMRLPAVLTVDSDPSRVVPWPSSADPDRVLLAGAVTLDTAVRYDTESSNPIGIVKIPIPNDPALAGGMLLFQWGIVFGPSDVRVSDVFGCRIRDRAWVVPGMEWLLQPLGTPPNWVPR